MGLASAPLYHTHGKLILKSVIIPAQPRPPIPGPWSQSSEGTMKNRYYLVTLAVLVLDHLTKWMVWSRVDLLQKIEVVPNYLRIIHVHNSGVAFSLFSETQSVWKPYILAGMAIVAVIVIFIYSSRISLERRLLQIALAVTMGGILGNFFDRIAHGFVVDFIELHFKDSFYWPAFNIADSAITIGIALLLIDTVKNPEAENEPQSQVSGKIE
jgi:signal peptidase II